LFGNRGSERERLAIAETFGQPEMVGFCKLAMLPLPSSPRKSPQGCSCIQPFGQPEMVGFLQAGDITAPFQPAKEPAMV
jgi:hypothetical protein